MTSEQEKEIETLKMISISVNNKNIKSKVRINRGIMTSKRGDFKKIGCKGMWNIIQSGWSV